MTALPTHRMQEVIADLETVSDKIRALDEAGFQRAEIARFLNKRYQHVRNVLVAPPKKDRGGRAGAAGRGTARKPPMAAHIQVGAGGRVVIPADLRAALEIGEGDILSARLVDGELRLLSPRAAVRKAQDLVRRHVPPSVSLVDQLFEDRRREAEAEADR